MKKWIVLIFALFGFGILAYLVLENKTSFFDSFIYNLVIFDRNNILTGFYKFITFFASEIMIILVSLIFFLKDRRYGIFVGLNAIIIFILNICLKLIFARERPAELMIITETGYSFPSGHAMAALGFYGFIIYLIWNMNLEKRAKVVFSTLICILIVLIGISRIYLGVHYASDVLAGFLISTVYLILYIQFTKKVLRKEVKDG